MKNLNNKSVLIFLFRLSYLLTIIYIMYEFFYHSSRNSVLPIVLVGSGLIIFSTLYTKKFALRYTIFGSGIDNVLLAVITILFSVLFIWQ